MRRSAILTLSFLAAILAACAQPIAGAAGGEPGRIIVRFTDAAPDPTAREFVAELAKSAQSELVYDRPVSGGAHLYIAPNLSGPEEAQRVADRLRQRSDVVAAEPDRRFTPSRGAP